MWRYFYLKITSRGVGFLPSKNLNKLLALTFLLFSFFYLCIHKVHIWIRKLDWSPPLFRVVYLFYLKHTVCNFRLYKNSFIVSNFVWLFKRIALGEVTYFVFDNSFLRPPPSCGPPCDPGGPSCPSGPRVVSGPVFRLDKRSVAMLNHTVSLSYLIISCGYIYS